MTGPRSHAAQLINADQVFRGVFAQSPNAYLVLTPDLYIVNANDAFLKVTQSDRDWLVGIYAFEAFPDNPSDPDASGVRNLTASFNRVRRDRCQDTLPLQRYDLYRNGVWQVRFWHPVVWPIIDDDDGSIIALVINTKEAQVPRNLRDLINETRTVLETTRAITDNLEDAVRHLTGEAPH